MMELNIYGSENVIGDPELNFNCTKMSQVIVKSFECKLLCLSKDNYYLVLKVKINQCKMSIGSNVIDKAIKISSILR